MNRCDSIEKAQKEESGQALILLAGILFCVVLVSLVVLQVRRVYQAANYVEETANAAVEAAIRPLASSVISGDVMIDPTEAQTQIKEDVARSAYFAAADYRLSVDDMVEDLAIEVINPPDGGCRFTGETVCYESPAVKVSIAVVVNILGFDVLLERTARGSLGAVAGYREQRPTIPPPTQIVLPTVEWLVTHTPVP